ncbi:MAG: adenine nucleotide alpha hydrolase family protein [Acidimicrobiia bacterium]|nr:adenine nucleotide alpha hydrolase family protein [Acidimicrobiia bacterium]
MKCRVCREKAVIDIRRHNAAFCREHFIHHCRQQVVRAMEKFDMIAREERVLVAVSGGKDSLMLWDVLLDLGYAADGLYIGLGIGEYSDASHEKAAEFAARREAHLVVVDLETSYGFGIPGGARSVRRAACSACGLSKRYVMNDAAITGGYDVLATGHNLDDEAAVLFGNVLHWNMDALVRQRPVLPASRGFVRKVKPLIRLGERETAAYSVLNGIDYIVEECPMVEGNTGLRYKAALNELETAAPGTKNQLYFGFVERALPHFEQLGAAGGAAVGECGRCGAPTTGDVCAFCRMRETAAPSAPRGAEGSEPELDPTP